MSNRSELVGRIVEAANEIDRARADNPTRYVIVRNPVVLSILKARIRSGSYE